MRIGLNVIGYAPGKMGGIETYFQSLLWQLQSIDRDNAYTVLCDEWNVGEFDLHNPRFTTNICSFRRKSLKKLLRDLLWKSIRIDILRAEPRYQKFDLMHHPFTTIKQKWWGTPSVLTFWDMQHEYYPEFFSLRELEKRNNTYRPSVAHATRIIVSSMFTRECLLERYGASPEKISVVYTGVSQECLQIPNEETISSVKARYSLERPFLYYPAATWPHKNHKTLLKAVSILSEQRSFDGDLVLTGIAMQGNDEIVAEIRRLGLEGRVKLLGYLQREELPCLYRMARIMAFPSLFEGFGIPLVEAMACGCPVVCANATSLPEVIGTAGELFDPARPEELAALIWALWNDDAKLERMRCDGQERSRLFDWSLTAEQTLAVYRQALS